MLVEIGIILFLSIIFLAVILKVWVLGEKIMAYHVKPDYSMKPYKCKENSELKKIRVKYKDKKKTLTKNTEHGRALEFKTGALGRTRVWIVTDGPDALDILQPNGGVQTGATSSKSMATIDEMEGMFISVIRWIRDVVEQGAISKFHGVLWMGVGGLIVYMIVMLIPALRGL